MSIIIINKKSMNIITDNMVIFEYHNYVSKKEPNGKWTLYKDNEKIITADEVGAFYNGDYWFKNDGKSQLVRDGKIIVKDAYHVWSFNRGGYYRVWENLYNRSFKLYDKNHKRVFRSIRKLTYIMVHNNGDIQIEYKKLKLHRIFLKKHPRYGRRKLWVPYNKVYRNNKVIFKGYMFGVEGLSWYDNETAYFAKTYFGKKKYMKLI